MTSKPNDASIAIIGVACRFPGANDYNEFWENLKNGVNSIREIPPERWDINTYYSPDIDAPNKSVSKWCGLVDNVEKFDNDFFSISPREAEHMDPQQRLLLEEAWRCIEDSGIGIKKLQKSKTAVYIGVMAVDHHKNSAAQGILVDAHSTLGAYQDMLANRISHVFRLTGQSQSIAAACASSVVSVHEAKQSLLSGQSDYAIAGGVSLNLNPWKYISFSKARMLSPDGQCKTFDADANGYVPGDGVGVLLLQRTRDAVKAGNRIYGLIKGTAVNHVGGGASITAPSVDAQVDVLSSAYNDAGVHPETVTYMEAHGTGTSLGDPIEVEALTRTFWKHTKERQFCTIGSVKTNIGHLEASAGVAGIIKVLLMMRHKKIVPSLNFETPNSVIDFEGTPFSVSTELIDWNDARNPLLAGVSSFGMGGVNSHIVLGAPPEESTLKNTPSKNNLFLLSAKSEKSLQSLAKAWRTFIKTSEYHSYTLNDICKTLATGRASFPYRCAIPVNTKSGIEHFLRHPLPVRHAPSPQHICLITGNPPLTSFSDVARFSGQNAFAFRKKTWRPEKHALYTFTAGFAYYNTLKEIGVLPNIVTGQGQAIWLSLAVSGMVGFEEAVSVLDGKKDADAIRLSCPNVDYYYAPGRRYISPYLFDGTYTKALIKGLAIEKNAFDYYVSKARLLMKSQFTFRKFISEWKNVLGLKEEDIASTLEETSLQRLPGKEKVLLLIIIVWALFKLNRKWDIKENRKIQDDRFYEIVDLIIDEVLPKKSLTKLFLSDTPDITAIAKTLNRHHKKINPRRPYTLLKEHQTLDVIRNIPAWIEAASKAKTSIPKNDNTVFFELGACPVRTDGAIQANASDSAFKKALLDLWLCGVDIDFTKLYPDSTFQKLPLPVYQFHGEKHRLPEAVPAYQEAERKHQKLHPLLHENTSDLKEQRFSSTFTGDEFFLADHIVQGKKVLPGAAYLEMARAAFERASGIPESHAGIVLRNVVWARPITVEDNPLSAHIGLFPRESGEITYEVYSLPDSPPRKERR